MTAAAAKRTVLAAASALTLLAVVVVGPAGGASGGKGDRNPPSPPGNPHVTGATPKQVGLAWDPAQDDVAVAGYYVYGDTGRASVAGTSYTITTLDCGQSTAVAVASFDQSGNRSAKVWTTVATTACPDVQPPSSPSGFVQSATTQTGVVLTWSPSTDDVGVVGYGVYRSTTRVASPSESSVTLSGLSCGSTYSYGVDAVDAAGNRSPIATTFVQTASCADGQAPTQPSGLAVASRSTDSLSLTWAASSDDVGVAGYRVSLNGSPATTVSQPGAVLGGLSCSTSYGVAVDAFDAAGNRSPASSISAATDVCPPPPPTSDTTPPTTPTGLAVANVTQSGMTVTWNASTDNVGVTGYDVSRNGTKVATVSGTSSSQTGLSCGTSYTFAVVARDAAGNSSQAGQVVAATSACSSPPPTSDTTPPSQPSSLAVAGATSSSVSLTWGASSDNVGVAGYRTYVNGSAGSTTTQTGATVSTLTCGTAYTFEVDAYDAAGNRSTRASVVGSTAACPDTQPPSVPTSIVTTSRTATSIALAWTASSDNTGVAGYGLYRGTTLVGTSGTTSGIFSGLTCNTSYTLAVDAYDAAGNRSQKATTLVSTTACPDTIPPSAPTGLAASNVTQTGLTLSWNASTDNVGVTGYDVYRGTTKMETVTTTSSSQTGLACGTSYTFGIVARDAAGNSSPQASFQSATPACSPTSSPSSGITYYVDTNGSDTTGTGSQSKPWRTIAKACSMTPGGAGNTIYVSAGMYAESATCSLRPMTNLLGAGVGKSVVRSASGIQKLIVLQNASASDNRQTIADLTLDGVNRSTANFGLWVQNVTGATITRIDVHGFKGPESSIMHGVAGGGIHLQGVSDSVLSNFSLANNSGTGSGGGSNWCSGDLAIGDLTRVSIHDGTISADIGYAVKVAGVGSSFRDVEVYGNDFQALSSSCQNWNTLDFELWNTGEVVNFDLHHNNFNRPLSLTSGLGSLSSGTRYHIHHNRWAVPPGNNYAIEMVTHSSEIDHNYFSGGIYPLFTNASEPRQQINVHHNVFDNTEGPTAVWHFPAGTLNSRFTKNTVVMRQPSWRDGVFSLAEMGFTGSTLDIRDNLFVSTYAIGDKLGLGLDAANIDHNLFRNLTSRGSNALTTDPQLPLTGGFPASYIPAASSATVLGAFADGTWAAGRP